MAHSVFISYSSTDSTIAQAICRELEAEGISCWIAPRDITPGIHWGEAIIEAINGSRVMLVVFSAGANKSQQVLREVERAVSKGVVLVPFRIEPVIPSKAMEYFLSSPHWFNALTPPIENHIERLKGLVKSILNSPVAVEDHSGAWIPTTTAAVVAESDRSPEDQVMAELRGSLEAALVRGREVGSGIDGTDAARTMSLHFDGLAKELARDEIGVMIAGARGDQAMSLASALAGIALSPQLLAPNAVISEFYSRGDAWSLAQSGSSDAVFSGPEQLAAAIAKSPAAALIDGWQSIGFPRAIAGQLRLAVAPDIHALTADPMLLTRVVGQSDLVLLVGTTAQNIKEEDRGAYQDLSAAADAVWPVVFSDGSSPAGGAGWWEDSELFGDALQIPVFQVPATGPGEFLMPRLRAAIRWHHYCRKLWRTGTMMTDVLGQRERQFANRRIAVKRQLSQIEQAEKGSGLGAPATAIVDRVRADISKIMKSLEGLNDRALSGDGAIVMPLKAEMNTVTLADFEIVVLPQGSVGKLRDVAADRITAVVLEVLGQQLEFDIRIIENALKVLLEEVRGASLALRPDGVIIAVPRFDPATLLRSTGKPFRSDHRVRIERSGMLGGLIGNSPEKQLERELPATVFQVGWEAQLFARSLVQQKLKQFSELLGAMAQQVSVALTVELEREKSIISDRGQKRIQLEAAAEEIEASLKEIELRGRQILEFQQASAEVESKVRQLCRAALGLR